MPEKRYTKVEEEVIQILDRLESEKPSSRPTLRLIDGGRTATRNRRRRPMRPPFNLASVTAGRPWIWIAAAFTFAFVAILARDTSENLALALALASIIAFIAPIFVNRRGGRDDHAAGPGGDVKLWRGRDVSFDPPSGPSLTDRVSRWLQDRRGQGPRR